MPDIEVKWCMGQSTGLEGRYIKPQSDSDNNIYLMVLEGHDKKAGYLDAVDFLTISEENRLKRQVKTLRSEKDQIKELESKINDMKKEFNIIHDALQDKCFYVEDLEKELKGKKS
jgi:hypothetical protein